MTRTQSGGFRPAEIQRFKEEIARYKRMSHKNIVRYIEADMDCETNSINIVLEFVSGGSIR